MTITEASLKSAIAFLVESLKVSLVNDLGTYLLSDRNGKFTQAMPSVRVIPPRLPTSYILYTGLKEQKEKLTTDGMNPVQNLGVEVIINREPDYRIYQIAPIDLRFEILINQFNLERSLVPVLTKIRNDERWTIIDQPKVLPYQETIDGFIYPCGKLSLYVSHLNLL